MFTREQGQDIRISTNNWLSPTIDARNKQEKRDRLFFITFGSLFLLLVIGAFASGAWLASRSWGDQVRDDQVFMQRCTHAGFNQRQCGFLADRRQDERRDHAASATLGAAALGIAASSLAISAGAQAGQ